MYRSHRAAGRIAAPAAVLTAAFALLVATAVPASADTIGSGDASAFGGQAQLTAEEVLPPTPLAEATFEGDSDPDESAVEIPADPLLISGTLNANAAVHADSDIASSLEAVTQAVEGPYNAVGVGSVEELTVLVEQLPEGGSLVSADVLRAEAAAVCQAGAVQYTANSEVINLQIGGEDVPLNDPLTEVLDGLNQGLADSGLNAVLDIERNVVTELEDGIAVDALVIKVLAAAGDDPLATVRLGHAEVSGVTCGDAPECSDTTDNDGDGVADADDPGCHTDGDASNPDSYDPLDDSEADGGPTVSPDAQAPAAQLPATGGDAVSTAGLAAVLAAGAIGVGVLRRRFG